MTADLDMIDVSANKLLHNLDVSGQMWTRPCGTWLPLAKLEMAGVVTALFYFTVPECVS